MIRSEHARQEMKEAKEIINSDANVNDKLKSLFKLICVAIKVGLSNRTNAKLIMDKVGADKIEPKRRESTNDSKEQTETTDNKEKE